jgi:hypothetical protein
MDTSRFSEVKTPQHDGTPRSHRLEVAHEVRELVEVQGLVFISPFRLVAQ